MHNHDDKYPPQPGFEPGTPRLQALVDTNAPTGSASLNIGYRLYYNIIVSYMFTAVY